MHPLRVIFPLLHTAWNLTVSVMICLTYACFT